jgi:hypothetical protein
LKSKRVEKRLEGKRRQRNECGELKWGKAAEEEATNCTENEERRAACGGSERQEAEYRRWQIENRTKRTEKKAADLKERKAGN